MRPFFNLLTIIFVAIGFFMPFVWALAVVTIFLAIGSSPAGVRADGKAKTGGLLGGFWDDAVISHKKQKGKMPDD